MNAQAQAIRRQLWFDTVSSHVHQVLNCDGSGKIPQFNPPYREPVWILPALYSGTAETIDWANRITAHYHQASPQNRSGENGIFCGSDFNIFQTNCFCGLYHDFRHLLTPEAQKVMRWHTEIVGRTYEGSAQPDFVFRGCNDNMPALATRGLVAAGQVLDNSALLTHARWNLRQLKALLQRSAWVGEFNSPTYSAVTLTCMAKIATIARDEEIRALALQIEHRLWAEVLLHYHPTTFHQAGPMSRAYSVNQAGHNGCLQLVFWHAFGSEHIGRDLIQSYFHPDGQEVVHFQGCHWQSIAEWCSLLNTELHVPEDLGRLVTERRYPAILRGRAEFHRTSNNGGQVQTETYMEEAFSLGTCSSGFWGGEQSAGLYITYRRQPVVRSFRDAATLYCKYRTDDQTLGLMEKSLDGGFEGEKFLPNQAWCSAWQQKNVALMLCTPAPTRGPLLSSSLKLNVLFPAHFGQITASIMGDGPRRNGAGGECADVLAVSVEAGEVYVHIQPLLPGNLPRQAAVRFSRQNAYEVLELINYEGPTRRFSELDLGRVLNGLVITVDEACKYPSLEIFHQQKSTARITDYLFVGMRYVEYLRDDAWFRIAMTPAPPGVMTELVDGLPTPKPIFESNQIDADTLPLLNQRSEPNFSFFPWEQLEIKGWPNSWIIGSRGVPGERPYSRRAESLRDVSDGSR